MNSPVKTTGSIKPLHQQSVTVLKGVGAQLGQRLEKLGLYHLQDLLFHLPYRYVDRTKVTPIGSLIPFQSAVVEGEVRGTNVVFGKRRSLICRIQDGTGSISLRFYHFSASQKNALANGSSVRCFGEVRPGASGLEMYHPEYQLLNEQNPAPLEQTLTPAYHTTDGISQPRLRSLIEQAFSLAKPNSLPDLFADKNTAENDIPLLSRLHYLHFPPQDAPLDLLLDGEHPYQQKLITEELTAYQLSLLRLRQQRQQQQAPALTKGDSLITQFKAGLSFELTGAQQRVCEEVSHDITQAIPMMRLLQGDVGAGKTIVAAIAALQAVDSKKQVALMAPTDILAEQHRNSFEAWLSPLGIKVGWLSGKQGVKQRREQLAALADGSAQVVIGTHALFQDEVIFHDLALVIIDEQHRFGVHQRLLLRNKGLRNKGRGKNLIPHQLIMTATPIPRTLAMSAYADLDYSVIDELPKGRIPIETVVISQKRREDIVERIRHACLEGRQAYWVCTLIEQSETLSAEAAEDTAATLQEQLPELNIGLVHGRLKPKEKEAIMSAFKAGDIKLLVATTVIEVGVDVPNASLMIIENPERLGLAQLHQLRGRVGRGNIASHCVLLYGEALSQHGKSRLQAMRETNDGFRIAEIDLELRGPGEVLGTRQTGDIAFKVANLERDMPLMPDIHTQAKALLQQRPVIAEQLIDRWVGRSEEFAQA
ncbi:MAG: ATP-dependent DNA helicase RecG [Cellvibrionaceae bacterium]